MARAFDGLRAKTKGNEAADELLRAAQSAWERYRDAQVAALWPFPEQGSYGSVLPMCIAEVKAQLTQARTRELHRMESPQEGNVCGSRWPE